MIGLNTAPVGMWPYPSCTVCEGLVATFECKPRDRIFRLDQADRSAKLGTDVQIYNQKDAVSVECLGCLKAYQNTCAELSFDSARALLFVEEGNVYARVAGGRRGQIFDIIASVLTTAGREIPVNLKVIIER